MGRVRPLDLIRRQWGAVYRTIKMSGRCGPEMKDVGLGDDALVQTPCTLREAHTLVLRFAANYQRKVSVGLPAKSVKTDSNRWDDHTRSRW